ncbi:DUF3164 family protein [Aeromonas sp. R9-1]|uniref:DUF3164 family protein n=1 Tax=Aeromonas sp. R9-1 TaxID=3138478 RepID=UPI0034A19E65
MNHITPVLRQNAQGHLVPEHLIPATDLLRDELVQALVREADALQQQMVANKAAMLQRIQDFLDLSAAEYGVPYGGAKGNVTLTSFDAALKVVRSVGEHRIFDEKIQAAKCLIDGCIARWAEGSSAEIRALVEHAFRVNKQGHMDVGQVMGLRKLEIRDPDWLAAMEAIADAITTLSKTEYVRLYRREASGAYRAISLDWAKL